MRPAFRSIGVLWASLVALACSTPPVAQAPACTPGTHTCDGNRVIECSEGGQYIPGMTCSGAAICTAGVCVQPAFTDTKSDTEIPDAGSEVDVAPDVVVVDVKPDIPDVPDILVDAQPDLVQDTWKPDVVKDVQFVDLQDQAFNPGPLKFEKLGNSVAKGNLRKVKWHPDGTFALVLAANGQVLRYDAGTAEVAATATLGQEVVDLDVAPSGAFFVILGKEASGQARIWRGDVDAQGSVTFAADALVEGGEPVAVVADAKGTSFALATRQSNPQTSTLSLWKPGQGITATKTFNAGGGIWDVMWSSPTTVITSHGVNGADSRTWDINANTVTANGWSPGFGNGGGAGWRPGGSYGIVTGWSSNVVYVFDGSWQSTTLPSVNNGAAPQAVGWNSIGTRALVVGRATGTALAATVSEHRPGKATSYPASVWVDQSITNFAANPWNGNLNTLLLDVAWRPNSVCDEGVVVGTDTADGSGFGLFIRFYDANDPACAPTP